MASDNTFLSQLLQMHQQQAQSQASQIAGSYGRGPQLQAAPPTAIAQQTQAGPPSPFTQSFQNNPQQNTANNQFDNIMNGGNGSSLMNGPMSYLQSIGNMLGIGSSNPGAQSGGNDAAAQAVSAAAPAAASGGTLSSLLSMIGLI